MNALNNLISDVPDLENIYKGPRIKIQQNLIKIDGFKIFKNY